MVEKANMGEQNRGYHVKEHKKVVQKHVSKLRQVKQTVSASVCHSSGPKGVSPCQKALLHGTVTREVNLTKKLTKLQKSKVEYKLQLPVSKRVYSKHIIAQFSVKRHHYKKTGS